ncbi:uncharacterized protein LOC133190679 [Saccostrea echinata]|uniref:uncharacterized protein LOC133190679 n=1 Tax=Saccostrea echinata TaxID=191078 RepID=UPI002A7F6586|nr:uncharacterized protein LOC133190679 [Saccostrea echinata]
MMFLRSCVLVAIAAKCFAGPMSQGDLEEFDKNVRVKLAVKVAESFETLTQQISKLNGDCMSKINTTIDQCASCNRKKKQYMGVLNVGSVLSVPVSEGTKLAKTIAESLSKESVQQFLGSNLRSVLKTLKGTFISIIKNKDIREIPMFFNNFQKNFASLRNSILNLPSTFNNLVGNIGSELRKLRFWRKKRSAACSACDQLQSDDSTVVIANVCGADAANGLANLSKSIENLQLLYEDAINGTVLTEIHTGTPQMTMSPSLSVSADLDHIIYSIETTTKTLAGVPGEKIIFTDKPASYAMLADKIYNDFV